MYVLYSSAVFEAVLTGYCLLARADTGHTLTLRRVCVCVCAGAVRIMSLVKNRFPISIYMI